MLCLRCLENDVCYERSKRWCSSCLDKRNKHNESRKDKNAAQTRAWEKRNPEKFKKYKREYSKRYRVEKPEKHKAWQKKYDSSKSRKAQKELYRKENRNKINLYKSEWDKSNPEKLAEYYKRYNKTHQPRIIRNTKQRARLKRENGGSFSWKEWVDLCEKYGNKCLWCGEKKELTVDHVIPLVKGGRNEIKNIQPLCRGCNSRKHDRILDFRNQSL